MSICISPSGEDLNVMSLSELTRALNVPVSRISKAVEQGIIRPHGTIGHSSIVALTDEEIAELRKQLQAPTS